MSDVPSVKEIFKHFNPSKAQAREMQKLSKEQALSAKASGDRQGYRIGKIQELGVKLERSKRIGQYQKGRKEKGTGRLSSKTLTGYKSLGAGMLKEIKRKMMKHLPGRTKKTY
tara:strand:- start:183 stop:521 length:339 start_codon:yes stop_codon:yes gene_type:complete